jgi:hypothetical protein
LSATSINSTLHNKVDITLGEEIPIGKPVGICQATDKDNLGYLTFELEPQNIYFAINKGRLRFVLGKLSYHWQLQSLICVRGPRP